MIAKTSLIIAIDGPAASGKGTLSRALAKELNFAHMDTGALYRAVAYEVLRAGADPSDEGDALKGVEALTQKAALSNVLDNPALRGEEIGEAASKIAAMGEARKRLVDLQRSFAQNPPEGFVGAVLDGRDIGTVICPDAALKLFITAAPEVRAQRRFKELQLRGVKGTYEAVLADMNARDARDMERKTAPLKPAPDAFVIDTSRMNESQALEKALEQARAKGF